MRFRRPRPISEMKLSVSASDRVAADGTPVPYWADLDNHQDKYDYPNAVAWWSVPGRRDVPGPATPAEPPETPQTDAEAVPRAEQQALRTARDAFVGDGEWLTEEYSASAMRLVEVIDAVLSVSDEMPRAERDALAVGFTPAEAHAWELVRAAASSYLRLTESEPHHGMEREEICHGFHSIQGWLAARPTMRAMEALGDD